VTWTRKFDHITPALRDLYWIPIRQRILFEHAMIVFKCPHGLALSYLADDCVLTAAAAGRRHLRSADTMELLVWRSRTVIGARDFAVLAAAVWNSLSSCSVQTFAQKLKTYYATFYGLLTYLLTYLCSASEDHLFCALQTHSLLCPRP